MKRLFQLCADSIKQNLIPGFFLQCVALVVLGLYYWVPASGGAFEWIGEVKQRYGVDTREISASIVAGTFVALLRVSLVIWALGLKAG